VGAKLLTKKKKSNPVKAKLQKGKGKQDEEERKVYSQTRHTPSSPPLTKHTLSAPIAPLNTQSW